MRQVWRLTLLLALSGLSLQLYFAARIALMNVIDPQSTTFQRSEMSRLLREQGQILWAQEWRSYDALGKHIKRAVIASEDAGFVDHSGVEWDALEKAWERNNRAQERVEAQKKRALERHERAVARALKRGRPVPEPPTALNSVPKVVGGSTITQQLAKNLFLSGERNFLRKGQEFVLTFMLEGLLSKERILTLYLNNVEWGEGVFGAEAAAHHYFHIGAAQLAPIQAARLAVMLPAPKRFEQQPRSGYVMGRAGTIAARMRDAELP
ncbi:MAG TPA: transglycosylase domain-containing protein [Aquabacterium sp.]|uniref:transglycosylase domain-containing protein n=1 Tax=Aquabacterium sp. TaxID=1872578 RepID=UPI002E3308AD|nr:transglycosylase domain-containing protein [Aquabacterium sp.]HEX5373583.1 transglycosylase domain-containing protein [Aquabacterium sp.]